MKMRWLHSAMVVLLLAPLGLGQRGPVSAVTTPAGDELSASYTLVFKDTKVTLGNGADFTATHYLSRHWGATLEGDFQRVSAYRANEYGVRGGVSYRLRSQGTFQPFVRGLLGWARLGADAGAHDVSRSDHGPSWSYQVSVGTDVHAWGPLFLRVGANVTDDPSVSWKYGGLLAGVAYHFKQQ